MNVYLDVFMLCAILLALLHWFPWRKLLGDDLPRLAAYAIGTLVLIGIPTLAHLRNPLAADVLLLTFWAALAGGGAGTVGAWIVDALVEGMHLKRDDSDRYGG